MQSKKLSRQIRKGRFIRKINLTGKAMVTVYKSNKNLLVQINDSSENHKTLFAFNTSTIKDSKTKTEKSIMAAKPVSDFIQKNKITNLVFNRNGFLYHGRIKAFVEELRNLKVAI